MANVLLLFPVLKHHGSKLTPQREDWEKHRPKECITNSQSLFCTLFYIYRQMEQKHYIAWDCTRLQFLESVPDSLSSCYFSFFETVMYCPVLVFHYFNSNVSFIQICTGLTTFTLFKHSPSLLPLSTLYPPLKYYIAVSSKFPCSFQVLSYFQLLSSLFFTQPPTNIEIMSFLSTISSPLA